jgi:hypothetical protein
MKLKAILTALLTAGVSAHANAGTTYLDNPQQYDMRQYLETAQYQVHQPLATRCLAEERRGHLTTPCERYKRDLNRLLRQQSSL